MAPERAECGGADDEALTNLLAYQLTECGGADDEAEEGERTTGTKYVANVSGDLWCHGTRYARQVRGQAVLRLRYAGGRYA